MPDDTPEQIDQNKKPERRLPGQSAVESVRVYQPMPGFNSPMPDEEEDGDGVSLGGGTGTLPQDRWSRHRMKYKPDRLDAVRQARHNIRTGISWKFTRQGHDYWEQVYNDLGELEQFLEDRRDGKV